MPSTRLRLSPAKRRERDANRQVEIDELNRVSERTGEGDPGPALKAALEAYRLAAHMDYEKGMADSLLNQGRLHAYAGRYRSALESFHAAFLGYQRGGLHEKLPLLQRNLGNIHLVAGQYAKAEARFSRSLSLSRKLGSVRDEILALIHLGMVEQFRGRFPAAAAHYEAALARARAGGERNQEANALMNLGSLRLQGGDPAGALANYELCRARWRELGDKIGVAESGCNIGKALISLRRFPAAETELRAALATARASGVARLELHVLTYLGELFTASDRPAHAGRFLKRALRFARRQKDQHAELGILLDLARLAQAAGRTAEARGHFRDAAALAEGLGESAALADARAGLADRKPHPGRRLRKTA